VTGETGGVDEDVVGRAGCEGRFGRLDVGDVERQDVGGPSLRGEVAGEGFEHVGAAGGEGDMSAGLGQSDGRRETDARGGAGGQRAAAVEAEGRRARERVGSGGQGAASP
jgi:hypothetical protein